MEQAHNRDVLLAYQIEWFRRAKRIEVRKFLVGQLAEDLKRGQSVQQMRQALTTLSSRYGIPLRTEKRRR